MLISKPRVEKDPRIPNDWPFKEQELKALEARRARALEEIEQKKLARRERTKNRKLGLVHDEDTKTEEESRVIQLELSMFEIARRGLSTRSLLKSSNCLMPFLEVLDARDPLGTRCTDMERMVMQAGPSKHLVLLLNKIVKKKSVTVGIIGLPNVGKSSLINSLKRAHVVNVRCHSWTDIGSLGQKREMVGLSWSCDAQIFRK